MKSYIGNVSLISFSLLLLYFAIFDVNTRYSKVLFVYDQKNYCLYYDATNYLALKPNRKVIGFINVYFRDSASTWSANSIIIKYDSDSKEIEIIGPSLPLKNSKEATGIFAKWCLEKNRQEIDEIMITAFLAVLKKEYPNVLFDPATKELKLR